MVLGGAFKGQIQSSRKVWEIDKNDKLSPKSEWVHTLMLFSLFSQFVYIVGNLVFYRTSSIFLRKETEMRYRALGMVLSKAEQMIN